MITNVRNPKWVSKKHEQLILEVKFQDSEQWDIYVTSDSDLGSTLHNLALQGLFGEIQPSDEELILAGEIPVPEGFVIKDGELVDITPYIESAQAEINKRLAVLNSEESKARAEIDEDFAAERKQKLAALLAVKEQEGYPFEIDWGDIL